MIIAIDGPAASGKGTLGKRLAAHYDLRHLDSGLIYRAVAKSLLDAGHSPGNRARAVAAAEAIDLSRFDEPALKRTVIFPDADVKIFVTATAEVRAGRRTAELQAVGAKVNVADVLADILRRDERDTTRATAPLKPAEDAHLLDTTHLDIDAAFRAAIDIVEAVRAGRVRG
jgi:cytidylate kinase